MASWRRAFLGHSCLLAAALTLAACGSEGVLSNDHPTEPVADAGLTFTSPVAATTTSVPATTTLTTTTTTPSTTTASSATTASTTTASTTTASTTTTSTSTTTTTTAIPPTTQPPKTVTVDISDLSYEPATVTISVGDSVRWSNQGIIQHTATGSFWDTGPVDSGATSGSVTFSEAGEFGYVCSFHSGQTGTIVVQQP